MYFKPFPVFLAYVFLSGKSADPNSPPLLVENSTNFFFKPSLTCNHRMFRIWLYDEKSLLDSDMTPWSVTKIMVCNADFLRKMFKMDCNWSVFLHLLKPISNWFECTCVKNVLKWTLIGQYFCTC